MAQYKMDHVNYDGSSDVWEITDAAARGSIADAYSASSTYALGDHVLYNGQLYECNTAITTAEAWTAAHWTAVTVGAEIATVKDGLSEVFKNELVANISASGNTWYQYNFVEGHKYAFINTGASTLVPKTVSSRGSYEQIEKIGTANLQSGSPTYFTPQYSAPYMHIYSSGVGSFKLYEIDTLFEVENNVDSNLTALSFEEDLTFTTGNGAVSPRITGTAVVITPSNSWNYALVDMASSDYVIAKVKTANNANILYFVWVDDSDVAVSADVFNITIETTQLLRSKKPAGATKVYVRNYNSNVFKIWKNVSTPLQIQVSKNSQNIENVYENSIDSSLSASGNVWIEFAIHAGHRYKFTNSANSSGVLLVYSTGTNGSYENIETLTRTGNIAAGKFIYVTAIYDAPYLRVYANNAAEFTVEEITTVNWLVDHTSNYFVDLPDYYTDAYLKGIVEKINDLAYEGYDSSFVFITDMHVFKNRMHSGELINYLSKHVDFPFVMYGGDTIMAYAATRGLDAQDAVLADVDTFNVKFANVLYKNGIQLFNVHGNHDFTIATSESDKTTGWTAPNGFTVQNVVGKNSLKIHGEAGKAYYYFDDDVAKIRYIVIDQWSQNSATSAVNTIGWGVGVSGDVADIDQFAWLIDALSINDYTIVIFSHASPNPDMSTTFPTAALWSLLVSFKNHTSWRYQNGSGTTLWETDFTSNNSELAFIMSGHNHLDKYGVKDGILSIVTTCDSYDDNDSEVERTQNTVSEQAFDFVVVNTTDKTVKTVRIGGGNNRAWNYETGAVIT